MSLVALVNAATPISVCKPLVGKLAVDVSISLDALDLDYNNFLEAAEHSYKINDAVSLSLEDRLVLKAFLEPPLGGQPVHDLDAAAHQNVAVIINYIEKKQPLNKKHEKFEGEGRGMHIGNGLILTAYHVVAEGMTTPYATDHDSVTLLNQPDRRMKYTLVAYNPLRDVALLKVPVLSSDSRTPLFYLTDGSPFSYFVERGGQGNDDPTPRPLHIPLVITDEEGVSIGGGISLNRIATIPTHYVIPGDSGLPVFDEHYRFAAILTGARYGTRVNRVAGIVDMCIIKTLLQRYFASVKK